MKVGDKIFVEQAWEDEAGHLHDEVAEVLCISKSGLVGFRFDRQDITEILLKCEFLAEDYEDCILDEGETSAAMKDTIRRKAKRAANDIFTSGTGEHWSHLSLDNDPKLGWCEVAIADKFELALRNVQRDTAEGCAKMAVTETHNGVVKSGSRLAKAIRERFGLKECG